jgi:hypothetical protein
LTSRLSKSSSTILLPVKTTKGRRGSQSLAYCSTVPPPTRALRLLVSALVFGIVTTVAEPSEAAVRRVQIYFLQGEQVVPVQRRVASVGDAVRGLIAGPNANERRRGFRS